MHCAPPSPTQYTQASPLASASADSHTRAAQQSAYVDNWFTGSWPASICPGTRSDAAVKLSPSLPRPGPSISRRSTTETLQAVLVLVFIASACAPAAYTWCLHPRRRASIYLRT
ncbi:hypothetical protein HYPSUDRAFT_46640 [Hypholoma sublateritium FD-334 SS-4]|uniref:Uncharacterized protein n=1 Tax=Hypholoma sublateritium (strain FD-334 SS-4) TaxID=945553 RepID=A0A0D2NL39_HYPSF|nr:hypothetical protein HYPSUDRAFT_46640 [Hypholoma sublateritium FD-334 SS-4]